MKKILVLVALATAAVLPAQAVTNIGVSIGINAPGQYGRIDIDNYPQAVLYTQQPIIYAPSPVAIYQRPIYLYVSPAHQATWGRYCNHYRACGQPVHFVRDDWVRGEYRRQHDQKRDGRAHKDRDRQDEGRNRGKDKGHDKRGD